MSWNHRLMFTEDNEGNRYFSVHEVYYKNKIPNSYTSKAIPIIHEELKDIFWTIDKIQECLKKPILWTGEKFPQIYNPNNVEKNQKENIKKTINEIFEVPPSSNQKAWSLINLLYHDIMTKFGENIDHSFSLTPLNSLKEIIEDVESVGVDIEIKIKEKNTDLYNIQNTYDKLNIYYSKEEIDGYTYIQLTSKNGFKKSVDLSGNFMEFDKEGKLVSY